MKTDITETSSGLSLWVGYFQERILIEAGMGKFEAEKYQRKFDNMIARFRLKLISDVEDIALKHYDPDDWDFREKVKAYQEKE
jgi:hypothetical protein